MLNLAMTIKFLILFFAALQDQNGTSSIIESTKGVFAMSKVEYTLVFFEIRINHWKVGCVYVIIRVVSKHQPKKENISRVTTALVE